MTRCEPFDIVLVPFPFSDLSTQKKRPALVLSRISFESKNHLYICAMITSRLKGEKLKGDIKLEHWKAAELPMESKVRLAKLVTLEGSLILKRLGDLSKIDRQNVQKEFAQLFSEML